MKNLFLIFLLLTSTCLGAPKYYGSFIGNADTATQATNGPSGHSIIDLFPANLNVGNMPVVNARLRQHLPLRILEIRDDQVKPEGYIQTSLNTVMRRNGSLSYDGVNVYFSTDGTGTFFSASGSSGHALWPGFLYCMANGSAFTNASTLSNGWPATVASIDYWGASGFGTWTVYTNDGAGAYGALTTVNADNGGAIQHYTTNIYFPRIAAAHTFVISSGTNVMVPCVGLYDTNAYAGYVWDTWSGDNYGVNTFTDTAAHSNAFVSTLIGKRYDVIIVNDLGSPEIDMPILNTTISNLNLYTAQVWVTPPPVFDSLVNSNAVFVSRSNMVAQAQLTLQPLIDLTPYFGNGHVALSNEFYDRPAAADDLLHTGLNGYALAGKVMTDQLGWTPSALVAYGYTNLNGGGAIDISGKANLSGGNAFSGLQIVNGGIVSTGTTSAFALGSRSGGTAQTSMWKEGNMLWCVGDSTVSYAQTFAVSNNTGVVYLDTSPSAASKVYVGKGFGGYIYYGDSFGLTNIFLSSLVSPTNTFTGTTWNLAVPESTIILSGNLTFTAVSGINSTNYSSSLIYAFGGGANRTITPAAGWYVNGFPSVSSFVITNANCTELMLKVQPGVFTNLIHNP